MTETPEALQGPLSGLVVVDLAWGMPTSVATMLLADYGAEVWRIERPADGIDSPLLDKIVERGKWRVELDPTAPTATATLDRLFARADVIVRAERGPWPDEAFHDLGNRHPHLIDVLLSAYGEGNPYIDRPGYDALVAARMGFTAEQRGHRNGPIFLGHPSLDYVTAFLVVIGALAAIRARHESGRGQHVDTSMLDGALALSTMNWWWNERGISYLKREDDGAGDAGGMDRFGRTRIIADKFLCSDDEWIMFHTGGLGGFYKVMQVLGLEAGIQKVDGADMGVPLSDEERVIARQRVPEVLRGRPRSEWLKLFHDADIAALPVLRPEEIFEDDQVRFADVAVDLPDDEFGLIRQVGPVVRYFGSPAGEPRPAGRPGQHTDLLAEVLGREPTRSTPGESPASALAGLRIIDMSAYFATAFGVRLLSDLGADVIKIEPCAGEQMRPLADLYEGANRGKRNLAIDLRTVEGREVLERLVRTSDVFVHNLRPGKAEALGFGYERLCELNPSIISAYLPGFGSAGPKSGLKSFAPLVSGFTGMLYVGAGEGNPPIDRVMGNEDLYNGFSGAMAILMALVHRDRTGNGQHVESPHLHSSLLVRTEQAADAEGNLLAGLQLDADQTGWGPLYRLYRTSDDWLMLACVGQRAFERLADALALDSLVVDERFDSVAGRRDNAYALANLLADRFAALTSQEAFQRLDAAGVPCEIPEPSPKMPEFLWEEWAIETGRVYEHYHPEHGWVREVGQCVRLADTPAVNKGTSARLGQHSREVLAELGYAEVEIEALVGSVCVAHDDQ